MKTYLLLLMVALFSSKASAQITPYQTALDSLDDLITLSPEKQFITQRAFRPKLYEVQRFAGATAVQQGKITSTSAVADAKSLTVNLSTKPICRWIAPQFTIRGTSADGVVSLFGSGQYQKTLSYGGSVNFLGTGIPFTRLTGFYFDLKDRDSLHQKLRLLRNQDTVGVKKLTETEKNQVFINRYGTPLKEFHHFWMAHSVLLKQLWKGTLKPDTQKARERDIQEFYRRQTQIQFLLPKDWNKSSWITDSTWVANALNTNDSTNIPRFLKGKRTVLEEIQRKKLVAFYDSIQDTAVWASRRIWWVNLGAFHNVTKLTQFASVTPTDIRTADYTNHTTDIQFSVNRAAIRSARRVYWSVGLQYSNKLPSDNDSLQTHRRIKSVSVGASSVQMLDTVQAYRAGDGISLPHKATLLGEYSTYWPKTKLGIDFTGQYKLASSTLKSTFTAGLFFPVATGSTTLILMPQVSLTGLTQWTTGIVISATIPAFLGVQ